MSESLDAIDDGWFTDADPEVPSSGPHSLADLQSKAPRPPTRTARGSFTPMPIPGTRQLAPEKVAEFSRPSLALGTNVTQTPAPDNDWFSQMRSLVPRRRARSSTLAPISAPPIPESIPESIPMLSPDFVMEAGQEEAEENPIKRPSWWRRLRKRD
jgi:hypothetical protein